jgi:hypothetical protein
LQEKEMVGDKMGSDVLELSRPESRSHDQHIGKVSDTIKELMSYPKCRSVTVINNPARPGSNRREVNCINYN